MIIEFTAAFVKLNGIIAGRSKPFITDTGAPIKYGVIKRFAGIITSVIVRVPTINEIAAPFLVRIFLYTRPDAKQKLPVEIMCIIIPYTPLAADTVVP